MSLLGAASFDIYETAQITQQFQGAGPGAIVPATGRCGTAAWHGTAAVGSGPSIGVNATTRSGYAGWAYNPEGYSSTENFSIIMASRTYPIAFIRVSADGSVEAWKGVNTVLGVMLGATPSGLVNTGQYVHLGVEWNIPDDATGYIRIYVNSVLQFDSGPLDMRTFYSYGQWDLLSWSPTGYIDDLYWGDTAGVAPWNAFFGDTHVEGQTALTDAASGGGGTFKQWTPSAGTDHGALVREIPPDGGTTYVASATSGQKDTFKFPPVVPLTGTVYGVQPMPNAAKNFSATLAIKNTTVSGGNASGTSQAISTTYRYYPQMFQVNPVSGLQWTIATTNAAEHGTEVT